MNDDEFGATLELDRPFCGGSTNVRVWPESAQFGAPQNVAFWHKADISALMSAFDLGCVKT
jgi:hypothetical protein